jgi:hypothetical protein
MSTWFFMKYHFSVILLDKILAGWFKREDSWRRDVSRLHTTEEEVTRFYSVDIR